MSKDGKKPEVRVRFAPSPTGFMHLGNIRAALFNYLFARQKNGKFILRIEDTDRERNVDEAGLKIIEDLTWLQIQYDEGPYLQSDRINFYQKHLDDLIANKLVYRCFCTPEELEKKRKEQVKQGLPPRYDRTCLSLSNDQIKQNLVDGKKFVWRFKINQDQVFDIKSMARKEIRFEMKHFSDFALTRSDQSFTFLFTNFVDDWLMNITHVIRGEDHLSNTAMQAALFDALAIDMPTFWHLPMICNREGKKLSKRDFGFVLDDLKAEGFLPQAICNYLAIVGSSSLKEEIQSLDELIQNFNFEEIHSSGSIKYDVEKLRWINHKWIERLDSKDLVSDIVPFLDKDIKQSEKAKESLPVGEEKLLYLIEKVKGDCKTLRDFSEQLLFCFQDPQLKKEDFLAHLGQEKADSFAGLISILVQHVPQREVFLTAFKREAKEAEFKPKESFGTLRYILTGKFSGLSLHDVLEMLTEKQIVARLENAQRIILP